MVTTLPVSDQQVVTLLGGLAVPVEALRILWALEERDFGVSLDDGVLLVSPGSKLTASDRHTITQHRDALRLLVRYCDDREGVQCPH